MKRSSRPTQHDIARAAGVSTAVVSLVINGRADGKVKIAPATQERVRTAIRDLGYVPNLAARQLAGGQTNVIGVFTYDPIFPIKPNSFYQPFLIGIEEQAEAAGYDLLLFTSTGADGSRRVYFDGVNRLRSVEGAVLVGTNEDRGELARLCQEQYPFVFVGRREVDGCRIAYTAADYAGGTADLVGRLVAHGHRHILYVRIDSLARNESAIDRLQGFHDGMARAGIPVDPRHIRQRNDITAADLRGWLEEGFTAIAFEQMVLARRALAIAAGSGVRVPQDLSLVALGNTDEPLIPQTEIDTFVIPHREMGAQAVALLHQMLTDPAGTPGRHIVIPCHTATGRTVGPVPERRSSPGP